MEPLDLWEKVRIAQSHLARVQHILDDLNNDAANGIKKQAKGRK